MTTPSTPTGDSATYCEWSDLLVTQCGHCQGVGPTVWRINLAPPEPRYPAGTRPIWSPKDDKQAPVRDWHDGDRPPAKGTRCRWNADTQAYVLPCHLPACTDRTCNGCQPCTHDDHGTPITHCRNPITPRIPCSEHLDPAHPHTCPRCIARVRSNLAQIERLASLMPDQATVDGIDSTAAMYAGPAAEPDKIERRGLLVVEATQGITNSTAPANRRLAAWAADILDETHPAYVCRQWELLVREHYGHPEPRFTAQDVADPRLIDTEKPATLSGAISYLSWVLTDLAQDPDQDFPTLADEVAECRTRMEAVLGASRAPVRGAPCKECEVPAPRLQLRRAHWCDEPDCTREHDTTGARDTWVCPRNGNHWWAEADYRKWAVERASATASRATA